LNPIAGKVGGGAGIRTPDTANMSRMLYHLSYTAIINTLKVKSNYFKEKSKNIQELSR
jgi:hypothetical protein